MSSSTKADEATGARFERLAPEYQATFARFLRRYYRSDLQQLYRRLQRVCAQRLLDFNVQLGTLLFRHPEQLLPLFHMALANEVGRNAGNEPLDGDGLLSIPLKIRRKIKVRVENLPPVAPLRKHAISAIRSNDVKQFIQIAGTVVRTGMIKMQEMEREYQCCNVRCRHRFLVKSDPEQGNVLEIPKVCPSDSTGDTSSGGKKPCKSMQFMPLGGAEGSVVSDHQVIKIQEQASKLGVGSIPRSMLVVLEDDLVDSVKAGDQVVVVGILMRTWKPCVRGVRCDLETTIKANSICIKNASTSHVLVTEELRAEFAQILGEAPTTSSGRTQRDRRKHLSESLRTVYCKTCGNAYTYRPRSALTTGIGTTSAGLTCTAVKDGGEWMLEAGALVLADRGVCCIDEFSSIRNNDRTSIHEAMEQQTLSVAKAGLVCKLNARTTIFAVTNPKSRYDPTRDVCVNTSIASPLLSRFDLILVLLDRMNPRWDNVVSSFILKQAVGTNTSVKEEAECHENEPAFTSVERQGPRSSAPEEGPAVWSIQTLQAYICYVKDKYQPQLSRAAMTILQRYYQRQRASDSRSAARTTIRLLESLTRLAQAHARLMCHSEVAVMDAVVAVFVMEVSKSTDNCSDMLEGGVESVLHSNFSENPQEEYMLQEKLVLDYLMLHEFSTADYSQSDFAASESPTSSQNRPLQQQPNPVTRYPLAADKHQEADVKDETVGDHCFPGTEEQQVSVTNGPWHGSQQQNEGTYSDRKQRHESPSSHSVPWSQRQHSLTPAPISQSKVNGDEDLDIMDDYRRGLHSQNRKERSDAPSQTRFDFGRWSQQAKVSHDSIISKWKK
ncbi:unnamed protein product [Peronospora destructor]|uniref:DNA helicase n=1 Tax=Peronospora destructor TaxID=86335 RepID=A0AAV0TIF7_9STRA|nr:unnamed protein product [Peronospora destructor]